tara:strand:+ start:174 stop:1034 length:861 start_codon:yes stop_codon:yes gene_type:complete
MTIEEDKNEELEVSVEEETVEKEEEVSEEIEQQEEVQVEEKPKKQSKFQKRIDDLTHKQREAERQRDEYYKVAQQVVEENKKLREQAQSNIKFGAEEMEGRLKSEIESANKEFKKAYEEGDADKIMEAQQKMIEASTQKTKLEQVKQYSDPSNFDESSSPTVVPPPNSKAVEWANENPWFNKDMVMTNAAYTIHDELVKSGVQGDSEDYYSKLDERIRSEFPHKFPDGKTTHQKNNVSNQTLVTPAGNQASTKSRKVRLSPSQVQVANRLGVPLEEYAKQFVALNN